MSEHSVLRTAACACLCGLAAHAQPINQTDQDGSALGFGGGSGAGVAWVDGGSGGLQWVSPAGPKGTFTSRVFDALQPASWTTLAWTPARPYLKELPGGGRSEVGYDAGAIDMTGNVLLLHLNGAKGPLDGGALVLDDSGLGNNGAVQLTGGGMSYDGGIFNQALSFDGFGGHVDFTLPTVNVGSNQVVSVSLWMYWRGTFGGSGQWADVIAFPGYDLTSSQTPPGFGFNTAQSDLWGIPSTGLTSTWVHIVAEFFNGSANQCLLFVNGVPQTQSQLLGTTGTGSAAPTVRLGDDTRAPGVVSYPFDGLLDEVALWNRALSPSEVRDLYRRGVEQLTFQVRACSDATCSTTPFVGPDGTGNTSFSELTPPVSLGPPTVAWPPTPNARFAQYAVTFVAQDAVSPVLDSVTLGPPHTTPADAGGASGPPTRYSVGCDCGETNALPGTLALLLLARCGRKPLRRNY